MNDLTAAQLHTCTERQRTLLEALATGLTARDVADREGVPATRVRREVRKMRDTLGARNNLQAVATAVRQGLI